MGNDSSTARRMFTRREVLGVAAGAVVCAAGLGLSGCFGGSGSGAGTAAASDAATTSIPVSDDATAAATSATTTAATPAATTAAATPVDALLARMTLEQKVAQLFFVRPEHITGVEVVTAAGAVTRKALETYPVGGLCYFSQNITGNQQFRTMLANTRTYSAAAGAGVPAFLGIDEEGGPLVARIANSGYFDVQKFPNMAEIGATGDPGQAAAVGSTIGAYLADIGLSNDFAPDADVLTNPSNEVIGPRSFGSDPALVSSMVSAEVTAMLGTGILPCVKHFPGHGDTAGDSHTGAVNTTRTADQLASCEYLPFEAAIAAGVPFIMVGHISTPNVTGDDIPASLSPKMIDGVLRGQLGYTGVVISDSFGMGAITQNYDATAAALAFLVAGGDIVLDSENFMAAYQGVIDAVGSGSITEKRIDESVRRILAAKERAGLVA